MIFAVDTTICLYLSKETVESGWARLKRNPRDIEGRNDDLLVAFLKRRNGWYTDAVKK